MYDFLKIIKAYLCKFHVYLWPLVNTHIFIQIVYLITTHEYLGKSTPKYRNGCYMRMSLRDPKYGYDAE